MCVCVKYVYMYIYIYVCVCMCVCDIYIIHSSVSGWGSLEESNFAPNHQGRGEYFGKSRLGAHLCRAADTKISKVL